MKGGMQMPDSKYELSKKITIASGLFIFIAIIYFSLKKNQVDYVSLSLWIIGLLIVTVFIYFIIEFISKNKNKLNEESIIIPKAVGIGELKENAKQKISSFDYWNHIKRFGKIIPHSYGKNLIYQFDIDLLYEDRKLDKKCIFLINANYPSRYSILPYSSTFYLVKKSANALSMNPELDPDIEKRVEVDLDSGKSITYEKRTKQKPKVENKKKEEIA